MDANKIIFIIVLIVILILIIPPIVRQIIPCVGNKTLQYSLYGIAHACMQITPMKKRVKLGGITYEGYGTQSTLIKCLYLTGFYEPPLTKYIKKYLKPGTIFVDIGANEGYFTLLAASMGCKTYAIEASPSNCKILKHNASLNKFKNIRICNVAAGKKNGKITLNENNFNGMWNTVGNKRRFPFLHKTSQIDVKMLDDIIEEEDIQNIGMIKIDVEGSEGDVMKGCRKILENESIIWIIESEIDTPEKLKFYNYFKKKIQKQKNAVRVLNI